jgi:hypothetical protein
MFFINLILHSLSQVWVSLTHNWPFLSISVGVGVILKLVLDQQKAAAFLMRYRRAGVLASTAVAVATPLLFVRHHRGGPRNDGGQHFMGADSRLHGRFTAYLARGIDLQRRLVRLALRLGVLTSLRSCWGCLAVPPPTSWNQAGC